MKKLFVLNTLSDYFLPLMQMLRSHIIKWCFISLICTGFGLFMAHPAVQTDHSTKAFSNWLGTIVDDASDSDLVQKLHTLSDSGADIYKLMRYASRHMNQADQTFDLPLATDDASADIMQVLLQQWNHFKSGNGMAKVPPPEIVKAAPSISVDKYGAASSYIHADRTSYRSITTPFFQTNVTLARGERPDPMSVGIAIGAP